jgi:hypothetical protein
VPVYEKNKDARKPARSGVLRLKERLYVKTGSDFTLMLADIPIQYVDRTRVRGFFMSITTIAQTE